MEKLLYYINSLNRSSSSVLRKISTFVIYKSEVANKCKIFKFKPEYISRLNKVYPNRDGYVWKKLKMYSTYVISDFKMWKVDVISVLLIFTLATPFLYFHF